MIFDPNNSAATSATSAPAISSRPASSIAASVAVAPSRKHQPVEDGGGNPPTEKEKPKGQPFDGISMGKFG
jgi:hypothetical protein